MGKLKSKTGLVLVLYSMIMTFIFILGIMVFINFQSLNKVNLLPEVVLTPSNDEIIKSFETGEAKVYTSSYVSATTIKNAYHSSLVKELPYVILIFCFLITVSTYLLWLILKNMNSRDTKRIVTVLNQIEDSRGIDNLDPELREVYFKIKDKFSRNIEDYKRLNSYISHEQKNALAILRTKLELKEDNSLLKSIDKVSDSIEDILTISSTRDDIKTTSIEVALVCADVCDEYSKISNNIEFEFDEEGNTTILAKERWIYRAVSNLVDNAIKYGNNSKVTVKVSNKKGSVIIEVRDNGIGMSAESSKKIFDNRYRVSELKKDGYGIGLSLVNHVCNLCDGIVWVESVEGEGSTFYLVFKEHNEEV